MLNYKVPLDEEKLILKNLKGKKDISSLRIKRYLSMPDLSRTSDSPLKELVDRIFAIKKFNSMDRIQVPEVVKADISFDLFNFPANHPARNRSDTYFLNDDYILRTHTTIMWYYYLQHPEIKKRIAEKKAVGSICYGKVYRKDEIDRSHMNVFHQIDGWHLAPKHEKIITIKDLKEILIEIAQSVFGKDIKYRFNQDTFPYTDPSLEMEIDVEGRWVEILGAGVVHKNVLESLGVDSEEYTGWAFGFGLERLAIISMNLPDIRLLWSEDIRIKRQLKLGNKFKEVSKYPPIVRDISFIVEDNFIPNDYFDLVREIASDLVEEVELLDKYENTKKFGNKKISYAFRITYRSLDKTLISTEADNLHRKVEEATKKTFKAQIR